MTNYTRHRTAAPALVRFMRSDIVQEAGFIVGVLAAAVVIDRLLWVLAVVTIKLGL